MMLKEWQLIEITVSTGYSRKMMMKYVNLHINFYHLCQFMDISQFFERLIVVIWINKDIFVGGSK
jgi:hypothetical protein